jgi:hypothetical protein
MVDCASMVNRLVRDSSIHLTELHDLKVANGVHILNRLTGDQPVVPR